MSLVRIFATVVFFSFAAANLSCNRQIKYPEKDDPIYADMQKEADLAQRQLEGALRAVDLAKAEIAKAPERSRAKKTAEYALYNVIREKEKAEQLVLFRRLQVKSRLQKVRTDYQRAYDAKQEWPNPDEAREYFTLKRLREAPREWKPKIAKKETPTPAPSAAGGSAETKH